MFAFYDYLDVFQSVYIKEFAKSQQYCADRPRKSLAVPLAALRGQWVHQLLLGRFNAPVGAPLYPLQQKYMADLHLLFLGF
jgi:hypothetical protein